jgi:hypothetical protein
VPALPIRNNRVTWQPLLAGDPDKNHRKELHQFVIQNGTKHKFSFLKDHSVSQI